MNKDYETKSCTNFERADGVGSVVDEQVVVTVQVEHVEPQHEALQDRVCLEGDDAVETLLVLRAQHGAVDLPVQLLQEVVLAQRLHVICNNTATS